MKNQKGFTLIEIMIVIAIIGILVAVAIPQFSAFTMKSKRVEAIHVLRTLHSAQMGFFATYDEFAPRWDDPQTIPWFGGVKADAPIVHKTLGLDPATTTEHGWIFGIYYGNDNGTDLQKTYSYRLILENNLDGDGFVDALLMNYKNSSFFGQPDGIPLLAKDDSSNLILIPYLP